MLTDRLDGCPSSCPPIRRPDTPPTRRRPAFRYFLPEADEWKAEESWPPLKSSHAEFALRADGGLAADEGEPGSREYWALGTGLNRARPSEIDPPPLLTWTTAPLDEDLDVAGDIELRLVASATALDTGWIVVVSDIAEDVVYRIPLLPNARRFHRGHRIRLTLTSDDQNPEAPAIMDFRHAPVGTSTINTVRSSSRLLLPVLG
jgi:uncharacterized protein